jgi:hypothetical protein
VTRQEITDQVTGAFGFLPGWMDEMPDSVLDQYWTTVSWVMSETKLTSRDKALVAFGAASAIHCTY